jgi:hypothetical protein
VAQLPQYAADRKRVYDDLGYYLRPQAATASFHQVTLAKWPRSVLLLSWMLGVVIGRRWLYRIDPEPVDIPEHAPVGIRGWLLIPAIVVVVSPVAVGLEVYAWARFLDVDRWSALQDSAVGPFKPWAGIVTLVGASCGILLIVGHLLLAWVFFTRRSSAPKMFVWVGWLTLILDLGVSMFLMTSHLAVQVGAARFAGQALRSVLEMTIYTAYMLQSKRVKATFVARLRSRGAKFDVAASPV